MLIPVKFRKISEIKLQNHIMNDSQNLLNLMKGDSIKFSKSDRKLIEVILQQPNETIHLSIAKLASLVGVSEPTVNRLCHKLGCDGYPEFKLRLAQEISGSGQLFIEDVERNDDSHQVIEKVLSSIEKSTQSLLKTIKPATLDKAAKAMVDSHSINLFGMGASSSVALDAQHKFFRFGIPVIAHTDFINQRMICTTLDERDVAIFISYTGRTKPILENAILAKQNGVTVIGITDPDSPLAANCDYVLSAVSAEDTDLFTPMTSRIMHLAVIDMLATMVVLILGESVEDNIRNIKINLAKTRQE